MKLAARTALLETAFRDIACQRMAGVPVLHARLHVQAVGFEAAEGVAVGVLVTPWFMNLLRLPLGDDAAMLPVGAKADREVGLRRFEFIGAHEPVLGAFEACPLFSPMFDFADQAAAVATAQAVLQQLRPEPVPPLRGFLFGRSASGAAA